MSLMKVTHRLQQIVENLIVDIFVFLGPEFSVCPSS